MPFPVGNRSGESPHFVFVSCSLSRKEPRNVSVQKFSTFVKWREVGEDRTVTYSRSKSAPAGTKKPTLCRSKGWACLMFEFKPLSRLRHFAVRRDSVNQGRQDARKCGAGDARRYSSSLGEFNQPIFSDDTLNLSRRNRLV